MRELVLLRDRSAAPCSSSRWPADGATRSAAGTVACARASVALSWFTRRIRGAGLARVDPRRACACAGLVRRARRLTRAGFAASHRPRSAVEVSSISSPASGSAASFSPAASSPRCSRTRPTTCSSTGGVQAGAAQGLIAAALRTVTKRFGEAVALDGWTSRSRQERSSRCSARTALGRRPHSRSCSGCVAPMRAPRRSSESTRDRCAPALRSG